MDKWLIRIKRPGNILNIHFDSDDRPGKAMDEWDAQIRNAEGGVHYELYESASGGPMKLRGTYYKGAA
jgi:hypothetical protein